MTPSEYVRTAFSFDLKAGFITAVVALPLAIAFAIASGVPAVMGLYTAVIAGLLGSGLGGSRFSITGPTGAMTVIILSTVGRFGLEGLLLAGFLAGLLQLAFGLIGLGKLVKYIPLPITVGFTAGIGLIIFIGQIANALGLSVQSHEFIGDTLADILAQSSAANPVAVGITGLTLLILVLFPVLSARIPFFKNVPPSLVALLCATGLVVVFLPSIPLVGEIPAALPQFEMVRFDFELLRNVLPSAFTIALLGSIEALLCAVVCDGMTSQKHESDRELRAQGIANMVLPFFGAIPATAAIARSAVNIREGAKTRMAGIIHALFLLLFILVLGPVVQFIPKAFLAGILMFVSVRMIEIDEFKTIAQVSRRDAGVLLVTFVLTVLTDLVFAVQIGLLLAVFLVVIRLSQVVDITSMADYDASNHIHPEIESDSVLGGKLAIYTIHGPFFFGAMNIFENKINEHLHARRPHIIIRMKHVPFIDTSGVGQLKNFIRNRQKHGGQVYFTSLQPDVKGILLTDSEFLHLISKQQLFSNTKLAITAIRKKLEAEKKT